MSKIFNIISFFGGIALLSYLVMDQGAANVWNDLTGLGWGIMWPILCAYLMMFCGSFCWLLSMKPGRFNGNIGHVYLANLAGQAVNQLTPFVGVGGEVIKATLLTKRAKSETLVVGLVHYNVSYTIWSLVLIFLGPLIMIFDDSLTMNTRLLTFGLALVFVVPVLGIFWLLRRGAVQSLFSLIKKLRLPINTEKLHSWALQVDEDLRTFRTNYPKRFFWSHIAIAGNRVFAVLEVYSIMYLLDIPGGLRMAILIMSLSQMVAWMFAFVPAQIGILEGAQEIIFKSIGFTAALGLQFEIVRRARKLTLNFFGLLCMAIVSRLPVAPTKPGMDHHQDLEESTPATLHPEENPPATV